MDTSNTLYTIRSDSHRKLFKLWYKERYGSIPRNVNTGNKKLPTDSDLDIGNRLIHIINTIRQKRNKN